MPSSLIDDPPLPSSLSLSLSNWRTSPFSCWSFHNIPSIIPCATIPNKPSFLLPINPTPTGNPLSTFALRLPSAPSLSLSGFFNATATDGFVILHNGHLIHESYSNGTTSTTPHILMSATKSIIGLLALILQAQHILDTTAPISTYIPEVDSTPYGGATVAQLLDMRTGVVLDNDDRAYRAATGWEGLDTDFPPSDLHAYFAGLSAESIAHGGAFSYVSANTDLLGWVLERAAGKPLAVLLSELLWKPMGAETPALMTLDPKGAPRPAGGMVCTVRDLARLGQLMVDDGFRGAESVIPLACIEDIEAGGDSEAWQQGQWAEGFAQLYPMMSYRAGWYVVDGAEGKMLFAMGIHGQNLFVDRKNRVVVAKCSSQVEENDYKAIGLTHMAVREVGRCLAGKGESGI